MELTVLHQDSAWAGGGWGSSGDQLSHLPENVRAKVHNHPCNSEEARDILITFDPSYPDNTPETALARIEELAERLQMRPNRFPSLARRPSECPTAMEGGKLGTLTRGQLYPELDAALFGLDAGQVSDPVESELGFHVLLCERIEPARQVLIGEAREGIRQLLEKRKRRNCQKAWLGQLRRAGDTRRLS